MSAHVVLNVLNELGKRDKMRGLLSIYLFRNEFNKFNNTRARMLDRNNCNILFDFKVSLQFHFCRKNVTILSFCTQRCYRRHNVSRKSKKTLIGSSITW